MLEPSHFDLLVAALLRLRTSAASLSLLQRHQRRESYYIRIHPLPLLENKLQCILHIVWYSFIFVEESQPTVNELHFDERLGLCMHLLVIRRVF